MRPMLPIRPARRNHSVPLRPISIAVCLLGAAQGGLALPQDAVPTFGQTTVRQTAPNQLDITQTTQRAGIDWTSFSIGANERVVVTQPGSSSVLLNRVLGNDPSQIFGSLQSNGSVWLVNPRGIVFGASARVDVGGLLASTLGISSDDVAAGRVVLGRGAGTAGELVQDGQITAPGGNVILVAPQLTQRGTIDARRIGLAAATEVTVDVEGDGLIFFNVRNDGSLDTRLSLLGNVLADGGVADVRAAARAGFADTVLNMDGVVQARSIGQRGGRIVIDGGRDGITTVAGRIDASGTDAGERGGEITLLGQKIGIAGTAVLDASGSAGGGTLLVGGDFQGKNTALPNAEMVSVLAGARLDASATQQGDGGKLIVWADGSTRFLGEVAATGGQHGGDGGFVEVSGKRYLDFRGTARLAAPLGQGGTLLLDPESLRIVDDTADSNVNGSGGTGDDITDALVGSDGVFAFNDFNSADPSIISKEQIATLTGGTGGALTLQADRNIEIVGTDTLTRSGALTLQAGRDIIVGSSITAGGTLTLSANDAGGDDNNTGRVQLAAGATITGTDVVITNAGTGGVHQLGGNISAGTLTLTGSANLTAASRWTLTGAASTIGGTLGGTGGLEKAGSAELILTAANTYAGTTTISGGTLTLGGTAGTLGAGAVTNNAALKFDRSGGIDLTVGVVISGSGSVTQAGSDTTILTAANTYTGGTTVSDGTLRLSSGTAKAGNASGAVTIASGATLDLTGGASIDNAVTSSGGRITNSAGSGTLGGAGSLALADGTTTEVGTTGTGTGLTLAGAMAGATGALEVTDGTVTVSANGTRGGTTAVDTGATLRISGGTSDVGSGAITLADGATLDITTTATVSNALTLAGSATLRSSTGNGTLAAAGGPLTLVDAETLTLAGGASSTLTIARVIADPAVVTTAPVVNVSGGTVVLSGINTTASDTNVAAGTTLGISGSGVAGGAIQLADGAALDIRNNASVANELVLAGDATLRSSIGGGTLLAGGGSLELVDNTTLTLAGGASSVLRIERVIADPGAVTVAPTVSVSSSTVDLAAAGTYTGATSVAAGSTLRVSGTGAAGTAAITLQDGATLDITAGATVANDLVLAGDATISSSTGTGTGTLALGSGPFALDLDNGATLTLAGGSTSTLALERALSATTGDVSVTGGTVLVTLANTHSGGTSLDGGTLRLSGGTATLGSGSIALGGGTLDLVNATVANAITSTGGAIANSSGTGTVNGTVALTSGTTALSGNDLTLAGALSGSGLLGIGSGDVTFTAANSHSGATTIASGATLTVGGSAGTLGTSAITNNGALVLARTGTLELTLANAIGGSGSLEQAGPETAVLTGSNTYSGTTLVSGGTLQVGSGASAGSLGTGAVTLDTGTTLAFSSSSDQAAANLIGGDGAVTKAGAGVLTLSGANTYAGGTTVSGGTLRLNNAAAAGAGGITLGAGTTLNLVGASISNDIDVTGNASITAGSGGGTLDSSGTLTVDATRTLTLAGSGGTLTLNRDIEQGGANAAVAVSAGTVVLTTGASDYAGGTAVASGATLRVSGSGVAGTGAITLNAGTLDVAGATVANAVTSNGGSISSSGTAVLGSTATLTLGSSSTTTLSSSGAGASLTLNGVIGGPATGAVAIASGSGSVVLAATNTYDGSTSIASGATLAVGSGAASGTLGDGAVTVNGTLRLDRDTTTSLTVGNTLSGTGSVVQAGSGTTIFTADNSYGGGTTVSAGTLQLGNNGATGTLGSGAVSLTGTLRVAHTDTQVLANTISGTGALVQAGSGGTTLTAANSYSGGTTVSAGTLTLSGSGTAGSGSIALGDNTLDIVGGASVANAVTLDSGATITNSSGTGTLAAGPAIALPASGNVTLSSTGDELRIARAFEVGAGTASVTFGGGDVLLGTGGSLDGGIAVASGATLRLTGSGSTGNGTLQLAAGSTLDISDGTTVANAVSSDGALVTNTSGTGTLAGTLTLLSASSVGSTASGLTFTGAIGDGGGSVGLTKTGSGNVTFAADNTYGGSTSVSAGTLTVGSGGTAGTLGSGAVTVASGTSLRFDRSDAVAVANAIGGAGGVTQLGSGSTALTGTSTYTGATLISAGTLAIGNGGASGAIASASAITNNATLRFDRDGSSTLVVGNTIGGSGALVQAGSGTTVLTADNGYSGTTTISAGVLQLGNGGGTGTLGSGALTNNATLRVNHNDTLVIANTISGTGALQQAGSGTTTLSANNGYSGGTAVNAGTLRLTGAGRAGSGSITLADETALDITGGASVANTLVAVGDATLRSSATGGGTLAAGGTLALAGTSTLTLDGSGSTLSIARSIDGATASVAVGAGSVVLGADNSHGSTSIAAGSTLTLGSGGTSGSAGSGGIANAGTLRVNRSDTLLLGNTISGTGSLAQIGAGTTVLTAANSYSGTTLVSAGTLQVGNSGTSGTLGSGAVTNNATLRFTRSDTLVLTSALGGSGGVEQTGNGTTVFAADNSYTGTTAISAGTLQIGNGGSAGTLGSGAVTNDGTLRIARSDAVTLTAAIGGSGALVQSGSGTTTLSAASTYAGGTQVDAGTLRLSGAAAKVGSGSVQLASGATLDLAGGATIDNAVDSAGGTLANSSGAGTLSGTLTLGAASTLSSTSAGVGSGLVLSGTVDDGASSFGLTKTGSGTATLSAANSYDGLTLVSAGTLATAGGAAIGDNARVDVATGATLQLGANETIGALSGAGSVALSGFTLTTGGNGDSTLFSGAIAGSGGLSKAGSGSFTLSGSNTFSGATQVLAGTLVLSGANRLADGSAVSVATGATLQLDGNDTVASLALAGTLNGSGTLSATTYTLSSGTVSVGANLGTGTLGSSGNSTLAGTSGATTVTVADTLTLVGAGRLAGGATVSVGSGATLALGGNETVTQLNLAGTLSGSGTLTATTYALQDGGVASVALGAGTLRADGSTRIENSVGATTVDVDSGTLTLVGAGRLAGGATVGIDGGATLVLGGNETVSQLNLSGTLDGSGHTLTAGSYALAGGTVLASLGTGTLTSTGNSRLDGTAAATTVQVEGGTLTLGSAERLANTAVLTIDGPSDGSGATLVLNGTETVDQLVLSGRILGTGTLIATNSGIGYDLNGGLVGSGVTLGDGTLESRGLSRLDGQSTAEFVNVRAGTLTLGAAERLADDTRLRVFSGATLATNFTETVGRLILTGGQRTGTGTVSAAVTESDGGTFDSPLGGGEFIVTGNTTINSTSAATVVRVEAGTLTLGAAGEFTATPAITVLADAGFNLNGNETAASLSLAGTLGGSGLLTAATYSLDGGTLGVNAALGSGVFTSTGASRLFGTVAASDVTVLGGSLTLQGVQRLATDATVQVDALGSLVLNGNNSIAALLLQGSVLGSGTLSAATYALDGGTAGAALGAGALTSQGASSITAAVGAGSVTVEGGTLTLGPAATLSDSAVLVVRGNSTLVLGHAETVGRLELGDGPASRGTLDGSGTLTAARYVLADGTAHAQLGAGVLDSSGSSALNGTVGAGTLNVNGGTLTLGSAARLTALPAATVAAGATLVLGGDESLGTLAGSGSVALGAATLTTGSGGDSSFGGVLSGTGALDKVGTGTFTLAGDNLHSGGTTVSAGTLALAGTDTLADGSSVTVATGATLAMTASDRIGHLQLSGTLQGPGTLTTTTTVLDSGTANADLLGSTLTSRGSSTLAGTAGFTSVRVDDGTLLLAAADRLADATAVSVASLATLTLTGDDRIDTLQLAGTLNGSGRLSGSAATLTGATVATDLAADNTITASGSNSTTARIGAARIEIAGGSLTTLGNDRLGDAAAVVVASDGTLQLGGTDTVASLSLAGLLSGSGTLSASTIELDSGRVQAALGSGALSSRGSSRLDGTADVASVAVLDGTLLLGGAALLRATPQVDVAAGASLQLGGNETFGSLAGAGTVALGAATLTTGDATSTTFDGVLGGSGNLVKQGTGTFTLGGSNSFTGSTSVAAGTLALSAAERLANGSTLDLAAGATLALTGTETIASGTLGGTVAGSGTLAATTLTLQGATVNADLGGGSLVVAASSTLAGRSAASTVQVDTGTLTLAAADRLADGASVSVADGATLALTGNDTVGTLALAGTLAGSGTLSATTTTLQGGTVLADLGGGTLVSRGASTLAGSAASTTVTVDDGSLTFGSAARLLAAPAVSVASGAALVLGGNETFGSLAGSGSVALGSAVLTTGNTTSTSFSGVLGGSGELVKQGSGTFTLAADQAYTGRTTVSAGTLAVAGTLASGEVLVSGGTLALQAADRLADAATLAVLAGATATLAGDDTVASLALAGTLGGTGTLTAASVALDGGTATADLGSGTLTSTGASRLDGRSAASTVQVTGGTLTLGSAARLTALPAATVAAGATLALGGNETLGTLAGSGSVALGAATLATGSGGDSSFGGVLSDTGGLVKQGSSTFTLAGNNVYTGGTTVDAGTLALAGANTLADSSAVAVARGATLAMTASDRIGSLTLAGTLQGPGTLTATSSALDGGRIATALVGGSLVSAGDSRIDGSATVSTLRLTGGTLTLAGANRLGSAPATTVDSGATLVLGGNETLGSLAGSGTVALGAATLATGSTGSSTFAGVLAGSGGLVKQGSGTFTLSGANTYSGSTQVQAGTLALLGNNRLADASDVTVATAATLALAGDDTVRSLLLRGTLAGSGTLSASSGATLDSGRADANLGAGLLVSRGSSTLAGTSAAGTVDVQTGTLTLAAADRLAGGADVSVASGATLTLNGNDAVASLLLRGTLAGSGRLDATTTTLDSGNVLADLGGGALVSQGASRLAGSSAATTVRVDSGTLTLASASRLQALPALTVAGGAALVLGGNERVGSLAGAGTLALGAAVLSTGASGADTTFAGSIGGSGGLTKQGSGDFTLSGANTYTGLTRVEAGTLTIGDGGSAGSVASAGFVVDGLLRSARADAVDFAQPISGSGGFEQAGSGTVRFSGGNKTYTGGTTVASGTLATTGSEQLPDNGDVTVATGAALVLGGDETLRSIAAQGDVTLAGLLAASGDITLQGAAIAAGGAAVTLRGQAITAVNAGNRWGSSVAIDAGGVLALDSGSEAGVRRDLVLGRVDVAAGGTVSAGVLAMQDALTVAGGTLSLVSSAAATAQAPDADLVGRLSPAQRQIAFTTDVVRQTAGSRIDVAETAGLQVLAENGGSVQLQAADNRFAGSLEVRSGGAVAPWAGNITSVNFGGGAQEVSLQSRVRVDGSTVRVGGAGIEADVVAIRADQLRTAPGAVIAARLPFDNLAGTTTALPALTLELTDAAFLISAPFGQGGGNEIAINVGSRAWGNRTLPLDSGYITVLPRNGARGSTAVVLSGPPVGGYTFFFDGAGLQTEIPVFYNGVLPVTPQVSGSIAATVSVSEGARKERFDDAVRTENVAVRLRSGVIAEVGPGRPATVGTEGARAPEGCTPAEGSLACAP